MFTRNSTRILPCLAATVLMAATAPATAEECTCLADHNFDHQIDGGDLGILLGDWSSQAPRSDFNHDGVVDGADLGVMLGAWGQCPAAENDNCAQALWITDGQYDFCTMGANTDGPIHPAGSCGGGVTAINHDLWYRYTAPMDGELTVTTCYGANFDSVIAVYGTPSGVAGCPGSGGTVLLGCNNASAECPFAQAELNVQVTAGHTYSIRVGGYQGAEGAGTLTVAMGYHGSSPQQAIWLGSGGFYEVDGYTGDNSDTVDFPTNCFGGSTPGPREYIQWYCSCNGTVTATTCSPETNFDTVLTVLEHSPSSPGTWWETVAACNDDSPLPGCQIGGVNRKSHVTFQGVGGHYYFFVISGYAGAQGDYEFTLSTNGCP